MLHLVNISEDALIHIASYLELDDLWRLRQVCVRLRTITSTDQVWRIASSRSELLLGNSDSSAGPWSSHVESELPASLVRDSMRAVRIDRRWSTVRICGIFGHPSPDGTTWSFVRLLGGQWVLCTDEQGDVTATHVTQLGWSLAQQRKSLIFESEFDPYCTWTSLVEWFPDPAVLIAQLKGDFRSVNIQCFSLPLGNAAASVNRLSQCKLKLGGISVLAMQVHASQRCLMVLCKNPNHEPRQVFLDVWRWGPDEEHARRPPQHTMRTAPFESKDCEFCLVGSKEGLHVFVVRTSTSTTHFEYYDLPRDEPSLCQIEPEPQIPFARASLPCESHGITLPQAGADDPGMTTTVLLCVARSAKQSEVMGYRVSLHSCNASLSFLGSSLLPEYFDVIDCVLGERGARGVASIAGPRRDTRILLALLTFTDIFRLDILEDPTFESLRPMRLAFDEVRATVVFLDDQGDMYAVFFDSNLYRKSIREMSSLTP